ncbi:MAG: phosphatase PAP2 family protein, partial [Methanosarcinales archaeon]
IWIFVTSVIIWTGYRNRGYLLGTLLLVDIIISTVLKVIIAKPRPPHYLVIAHEKTFSMPSGHAERISAVGTFLSNLGRRLTYIFVIIIFLVCFSRVYLGVHYPSDIFAGLIIGTILGYCAFRIEKKRIPITNFHRTVLFFAAMLYALVSYLFISEYKILLSFASFGFFVGMLIESNFQLISSPSEKKKLMERIFLGSFGLTLMMWIYSVLSSFILKAIMASFIGLWITLLAPILFKKLKL